MRPAALLDVIEAAYAGDTAGSWLRRVLEALRHPLDRGDGLLGYEFDARDPRAIRLTDPIFAGAGRDVWRAMQASTQGLELRAVRRTYLGSRPFGSVAQRFPGNARAIFLELSRRFYRPSGFDDLLVLHAVTVDRQGCVIAAPMRRAGTYSRKELTRWSRVAGHVAAGYRMSHGSRTRGAARFDECDAVLDPGGKIVHLGDSALSPDARDALRRAAVAVDRVRTSRARAAGETALSAWDELASGRWTLVDRFDTDGRRFLIAHANDPVAARRFRLTGRERSLLESALRGHSNKVMAHEFSVTEATVSECVRRALAKLNARSIAELQLFRSRMQR
jgi:DNA-binding CsgD family transcriptional regulator